MSPRSEEFMARAEQRIGAARVALAAGYPSAAVSGAYYAMLYAARAALSERERYAKTHSGTWSLFAELFVVPGGFDPDLVKAARRIRELREAGDYDASEPPPDEARTVIGDAERFVAAVAGMLSG